MYRILKAYCIAILFLAPLFGADYPISEYFNILINDSKVGYSSVLTEKTIFETKTCLKETTYMLFEIKRFKDSIKMETKTELYFSEELEPYYFKSYENLTGQERFMEGRIKQNKAYITDKFAGKEEKKEFALPPGTIFAGMLDNFLRKAGLFSNKSYVVKVFDNSMLSVADVKIKINGLEKQTAGNREYSCYAIDTEMYNILTSIYVDKQGYTIRTKNAQLGLEEVIATEAEAKKSFSANVDILSDFAVKCSRIIERPGDVKEMNCSLVFEKGLPEGLNQNSLSGTSIKIIKENMAICTLRRTEFPVEKAAAFPIGEKGLEKYLKPSPYEQSEDAELIKTARTIAGNEKNSLKAAGKIVNWVNGRVVNKSFSSVFATAKETFDSKQGDCKGHAVLASALCKALGIPAKIAAGIYPVNDRFYYHMWLEVYLGNGNWAAMDPTFNETVLDAAHIKLVEGTLDDAGKLAFMVEVYKYFKNMEVVVFKLIYR